MVGIPDGATVVGSQTAQAPGRAAWMRAIVLCSLVAFLDGFDTQALGPTATAIAAERNIPMSAFGTIFSASQVGFLIGALLLGTLGDRFGRKRVLLFAVATFALCSLGTALAPDHGTLFACRLLAGFGLGGATPNFVSLASEHSPPAHRGRVVTMMWAAVPLGGMVSALTTAAILPTLGWKAVFYIGCAAPLLLLPILVFALPESREVAALDASVDRRPVPNALFGEGRAASTIWLWLSSFAAWMALIVVVFWTPALLMRAGLPAPAAATVLALHNVGGITGTLLIGALMGRVRPHILLTATLAASGVFVALMGQLVQAGPALAAVTIAAGFCASAAGAALIATSSAIYPTEARSTGVGFALSAGRVGTIIGPIAAGSLVAASLPVDQIYAVIAVPAFAAAIFVMLMARRTTALARG